MRVVVPCAKATWSQLPSRQVVAAPTIVAITQASAKTRRSVDQTIQLSVLCVYQKAMAWKTIRRWTELAIGSGTMRKLIQWISIKISWRWAPPNSRFRRSWRTTIKTRRQLTAPFSWTHLPRIQGVLRPRTSALILRVTILISWSLQFIQIRQNQSVMSCKVKFRIWRR